eukprot:3791373-Amphidinium_carterae.1
MPLWVCADGLQLMRVQNHVEPSIAGGANVRYCLSAPLPLYCLEGKCHPTHCDSVTVIKEPAHITTRRST